jgi:hypothetical protein
MQQCSEVGPLGGDWIMKENELMHLWNNEEELCYKSKLSLCFPASMK